MRDVIIYWLIAFREECTDYLNDIVSGHNGLICAKSEGWVWLKIYENGDIPPYLLGGDLLENTFLHYVLGEAEVLVN